MRQREREKKWRYILKKRKEVPAGYSNNSQTNVYFILMLTETIESITNNMTYMFWVHQDIKWTRVYKKKLRNPSINCTNVSYVMGHAWASSLFCLCIVSFLWVVVISWYGYVKCCILYTSDGLWLTIYACYSWEMVKMASTHHSITNRPGMEYGRRQGTLIIRSFMQPMRRFPTEFSASVTLLQ